MTQNKTRDEILDKIADEIMGEFSHGTMIDRVIKRHSRDAALFGFDAAEKQYLGEIEDLREERDKLIEAHDDMVSLNKSFQDIFRRIDPEIDKLNAEIESLKADLESAQNLISDALDSWGDYWPKPNTKAAAVLRRMKLLYEQMQNQI